MEDAFFKAFQVWADQPSAAHSQINESLEIVGVLGAFVYVPSREVFCGHEYYVYIPFHEVERTGKFDRVCT